MIIEVTDPHDPALADYANLTDARLRAGDLARGHPCFIAEGELVVRRLLDSRFPVRSLLVSARGIARLCDVLDTVAAPVYTAHDALLEQVTGFSFHRGVLASGQRLPLPPVDALLQSPLLVVLEDTANVDNMGAMFRNVACLAGPAAAIILSLGCCDPLYRKALRVSIGYALTVPYARAQRWPQTLADIAAAGYTLLAMTPGHGAADLRSFERPPKMALVLGAEGPGLTAEVLAHCHQRVQIPMAPGADSLNVATAAAVALSYLV